MTDCHDTTADQEDDLEQLNKSLEDISIQGKVASTSSTSLIKPKEAVLYRKT